MIANERYVAVADDSVAGVDDVASRLRCQPFTDWKDAEPATELNFKFYRQATNKIVGISDEATAFLKDFF